MKVNEGQTLHRYDEQAFDLFRGWPTVSSEAMQNTRAY